jgi:dihydrolipoamide dehydrogenase
MDLVVIGAGPGGYVAAIRASQLGMKVCCVEKDPTLGGTCLNVGCIPTKALLESSQKYAETKKELATHGVRVQGVELDLPALMARKDKTVKILTEGVNSLFKKNAVTRLQGVARLVAPGRVVVRKPDGTEETLTCDKVLVATGSAPTCPPFIKLDEDRVVSSTGALRLPAVPGHLLVLGAGVIGVELGSVWARLGAKVTVLEMLDRALPGVDGEIALAATKLLSMQGLTFKLGRKVKSAVVEGDTVVVEHAGADGTVETIRGDRLLVATGRKPYTEGLGCAEAGLKLDERGRIVTGDQWQTSLPGVWAIGDVVKGWMLAHKAEEEGLAAVETMAGLKGHVDPNAIPNVVYTHPEIAGVGKTEEELKAAGVAYKKGSFPFRGNGRARTLGSLDGMVKVLADQATDRILGVHILGPQASELIAEAAVAISLQASAEDVARSCHAHPTLAEAIKEAALAVDGRAIHV